MMIRSRYWNANAANVVIVAKEGEHHDYAAYIGALPGFVSTEEAVEHVIRHGDKIEREFAEFLFPTFKEAGLEYRK